jgi:hypothetical protein
MKKKLYQGVKNPYGNYNNQNYVYQREKANFKLTWVSCFARTRRLKHGRFDSPFALQQVSFFGDMKKNSYQGERQIHLTNYQKYVYQRKR